MMAPLCGTPSLPCGPRGDAPQLMRSSTALSPRPQSSQTVLWAQGLGPCRALGLPIDGWRIQCSLRISSPRSVEPLIN